MNTEGGLSVSDKTLSALSNLNNPYSKQIYQLHSELYRI